MIWANAQRGLRPATKLLLIQLADHHNPVYGCFPGQKLLSDECEMSERSVRDHLGILEGLGLIRRIKSGGTGTRRRSDRYVFAFEDEKNTGQKTDIQNEETGKTAQSDAANTGKIASELPAKPRINYRQNLPPNLVREPVRETYVGGTGAAHASIEFDRFWETFPRPRNRDRCKLMFLKATQDGIAAEEIQKAAERYRVENIGNKPMYVSYADNWLDQRRWEDYRTKQAVLSKNTAVHDAAIFWAQKVKAAKYIPRNAFGPEIADCMIASGLVTQQDLLRAGVQS